MKLTFKRRLPTIDTDMIKQAREEIIPINSIYLWKDNPRINDGAAEKLAPVLKKHGQITAVVVWTKNRVAYKGNTTLKAMKINKASKVRVQWVDFVDEAAAIAYGLADNRASEFSYWDDEVLEKLMTTGKLDYQDIGFTKKEFQAVTLLPDLQVMASRVKKVLDKPVIISVRCEKVIEKEVRTNLNLLLKQYGGRAEIL